MTDVAKGTLIGTLIGTGITMAVGLGCVFTYKAINKKKEAENDIRDMILVEKQNIKIYEITAAKLKAEASRLAGYITENTLTMDAIKSFNTKEWSDKLMVVNEAWKISETNLKLAKTKLEVLLELQEN